MMISVLIAIAIVGAGIVMACAGAFLVLTAPDDALPDDGELGGEAFIAVRPDRLPLAPPLADSELGLAAGNGGGPLFQFGDDAFVFREGELAAPAVPIRGRFRLVK